MPPTQTTVTFWKPELLIRAQAGGLYVAVQAAAPSSPSASSTRRQFVS